MPQVQANGLTISYEESGAGEPLLLLHGGESDRFQFDVFRPLLGDGIRAIAYDQRDSPQLPYESDYSMRDHADDCAAFIGALGLQRAHILGTSFGGAIAMMTAIHHPERVQSLILAATTPSASMTEAAVLELVRTLGAEDIHRFMLTAVITPEAVDTDATLLAEAQAVLRPRSAQAMARRRVGIMAHDCRDDLARIQAPTLVLHGDDDPIVSLATAKWMTERIPGATLEVLEGSRHGVTLQYRDRTAAFVRPFVLAHPVAAAP